jgi:hypothetical protein
VRLIHCKVGVHCAVGLAMKVASFTLFICWYVSSSRLPIDMQTLVCSFTYDHRRRTILGPVRSPHGKPSTGGLVVRWVTTGEYPLLYVFAYLLDSFFLFGNVEGGPSPQEAFGALHRSLLFRTLLPHQSVFIIHCYLIFVQVRSVLIPALKYEC